ncbi:hypothetical protein FA13DRAFT_1740368, partial [Coprinellus micaceus]
TEGEGFFVQLLTSAIRSPPRPRPHVLTESSESEREQCSEVRHPVPNDEPSLDV